MTDNVKIIRDLFDAFGPRHVLAAGHDEVVATGARSGVARPKGKSFASDWGMVFGLREGQVTSFRVGRGHRATCCSLPPLVDRCHPERSEGSF